MALGMRLGDVTAVDAVHSLDQGEAIVSGVHAPVFLDVGSGRADDVHVYAQAPAAAKVEHQGGSALEDEGAAGTGQGFQQGEGSDDLFYKYGVGGVVIGRRFFYPF